MIDINIPSHSRSKVKCLACYNCKKKERKKKEKMNNLGHLKLPHMPIECVLNCYTKHVRGKKGKDFNMK